VGRKEKEEEEKGVRVGWSTWGKTRIDKVESNYKGVSGFS
jgi:hypothetical protein